MQLDEPHGKPSECGDSSPMYQLFYRRGGMDPAQDVTMIRREMRSSLANDAVEEGRAGRAGVQ